MPTDREQTLDESKHEVEGTVPSQWWLDLRIERDQLRAALTEIAEITGKPSPLGDREKVHHIARKAIL